MSTCASFSGLLLHWSTVIYISKKSYFQVKSWTSAIDYISYHIALRYCSNRLCVLLLCIGTFPTLSPIGLNSSASFSSPLSIKKAWNVLDTVQNFPFQGLKFFKVLVSFEHSLSPGVSSFSISFSSSLSISMTSWEVPICTNGLHQLLFGKKTVTAWKFVMLIPLPGATSWTRFSISLSTEASRSRDPPLLSQ